jgi:hypothetical protein
VVSHRSNLYLLSFEQFAYDPLADFADSAGDEEKDFVKVIPRTSYLGGEGLIPISQPEHHNP